MKHVKRHPILALLVVIGTLVSPGFSQAMILTDSNTFDGFSVTYDSDVWGGLKFPHEADSYSQTLPVAQFGYGRFFFDPAFRVSSDGTSGPSELRVTGEITDFGSLQAQNRNLNTADIMAFDTDIGRTRLFTHAQTLLTGRCGVDPAHYSSCICCQRNFPA